MYHHCMDHAERDWSLLYAVACVTPAMRERIEAGEYPTASRENLVSLFARQVFDVLVGKQKIEDVSAEAINYVALLKERIDEERQRNTPLKSMGSL